jgi:hypothetical protein
MEYPQAMQLTGVQDFFVDCAGRGIKREPDALGSDTIQGRLRAPVGKKLARVARGVGVSRRSSYLQGAADLVALRWST